MERIKSEFADQFTRCLKAFYQGRLPSFAKIARDFSLRAPHLPHVSAETVRHWVRGSSLPHVSRMQVLVEWLGADVAASFEKHTHAVLADKPFIQSDQSFSLNQVLSHLGEPQAGQESTPADILTVLNRLTQQERQAVKQIAQLLLVKHLNNQQPNSDDDQTLLPES